MSSSIVVPVDRLLQHQRDEVRRPALDRVRLERGMARSRARRHRCAAAGCRADELGVGRFGKDDLRVREALLQHPPDPRHRAAGAVAGDEIVEPLALEVSEDLGRGGALVDVGVGPGLELVGEEPAVLVGELLGLHVHPVALERARGQHHLGAEEAHELAPLDREAVGHRDDKGIALGGADHRKADAGVAARRLDDGLARLQRPVALGGLDDAERKAVLDRAGRVEELALDVEGRVLRGEPVDLHDRGVADRVDDAVVEPAASLGPTGGTPPLPLSIPMVPSLSAPPTPGATPSLSRAAGSGKGAAGCVGSV